MPRVPQAENTVRIAGLPSARSTVNYSPETFGAGIGRGLGDVASAVGAYAEREREKQDRAALMGAERKLQEWQNQALFAPDTGAFAQRGQNAFGLPDRLLPDWDKQVGDVESGLTDRQREVFRQRAGDMRVSMERDLMRHVGSEAESFQKQETNALVTTRLETAMLYWQDPARFDKELREAQQVFLAGNDALPPAAARVGLTEIESRARASVVGKMIEGDPLGAQRYFDTYRDKMTEADRAQVERILKPAELDARADQEVARATGRGVAGMAPPSDYATFRRRLESGGNATAKNPKSSAYGADQFIESTWMSMVNKTRPAWAEGLGRAEILAMRADPEKSAQMADALAQYNGEALQRAGVPVTNETLYAAHHFGADAAVRFAKAGENTPVEDILSAEAMKANGYLRGKTKGEVIQNWNRRAGATASEAPSATPPTKAEALTYLNGLQDPALRKVALAKYNDQISIQKIAEAEREEAFTESINTKIEAATPGTPLRQVLSPQEFAWAAEQGKLDAWEGRMRQRVSGLEPTTNPAVFDQLQSLMVRAENGDAKALAEVKTLDVTRLFTSLDRSARDYIQNRRQAIIGADGKKTPKLNFASEDELLNVEVFDKLGISKNVQKDDSPETKTVRLKFMQSYWAAVESKQAEVGRDLTSAERQQIMRDQLLPFSRAVRDSFLYFDGTESKRSFEIGPVPALDRQQIAAAYQKVYGAAPTDAQIRAEWLRAQGYTPQMETP